MTKKPLEIDLVFFDCIFFKDELPKLYTLTDTLHYKKK